MRVEFELMVGEGAVLTMEKNWRKWCGLILSKEEDEVTHSEQLQWKAVQQLDSGVRSPGANSRGHPLFKLHKVRKPFLSHYPPYIACMPNFIIYSLGFHSSKS